MLRSSKMALIALVAIAPFALSASADAKPLGPKIINGPKFYPKPYPHPYPKPHKPHWHPQYRPVIVVEQPIVRQIVQQPVTRVVSQPAPRTSNCLTKEYTPEGMLIFKDLCTKEMASTPIPGTPAAAAAMQQQLLQQQQSNAQTVPEGNVQIAPTVPAGQPVAQQTNAQTAAPKAAATDGVAN